MYYYVWISILFTYAYLLDSKLFAERRREHQLMIRSMLASENYEKNFKLLQIAYGKIFEVLFAKFKMFNQYSEGSISLNR